MTKALTQQYILEVIGDSCPLDIREEVRLLWGYYDLGMDTEYFNWSREDENFFCDSYRVNKDAYPAIDNYLMQHNITDCLIHFL